MTWMKSIFQNNRTNLQLHGRRFSPSIASVYSQLRSFPVMAEDISRHKRSVPTPSSCPPNASGWDDGGVYRRMHYQTWNSEQGHVSEIWSNFYQGALCKQSDRTNRKRYFTGIFRSGQNNGISGMGHESLLLLAICDNLETLQVSHEQPRWNPPKVTVKRSSTS